MKPKRRAPGPRVFARLTRRLEIRPLRAGDYERWRAAAVGIDSRKRNRWDMKPPLKELTRARFARLLRRQLDQRKLDSFYDFAVIRRDTGELVGKVALMSVDRGLA